MRGYKGSWGAIRWALSGTSSGPGVVLSVTPGAIQALEVLYKLFLNGL